MATRRAVSGDLSPVASRVAELIQVRGLADANTPLLLMVSGGSDSVALSYLCAQFREQGLTGPLAMLHVNHKLRGAASDGDALFVERLAQVLEIPLFMCELNPDALQGPGVNMEAQARAQRYASAKDALESLCLHTGFDPADGVVCTAHTADDRVENFFMRAMVGTGPGGFRSMDHAAMLQGMRVVRPLLEESRDDLREYIGSVPFAISSDVDGTHPGGLWREDATNAQTDRFRTFVRHELVAKAKQRNPQLLATMTRTMNLIADEDDMLVAQARDLLVSLVTPIGRVPGEGFVVKPELAEHPAPMQRRVFDRLLSMMLGTDGRVESASVQACLETLGRPGAVANIQGDIALSYNKQGLRIEPMAAFRARRKR